MGIGLVLACGLAALATRPVLDNVHDVVPAAVYRSAQLSPEHLERLVERYHLHAILNLRGAQLGVPWYDEEVRTARRLGVEHVDFELSAVRDVPVPVAARLVKVMTDLPKPLLIHCQAGADRSGLAAALYRYAVMHEPPTEAAGALSVLYGHVPLLQSGTAAMDRSYWAFVRSHSETPARDALPATTR